MGRIAHKESCLVSFNWGSRNPKTFRIRVKRRHIVNLYRLYGIDKIRAKSTFLKIGGMDPPVRVCAPIPHCIFPGPANYILRNEERERGQPTAIDMNLWGRLGWGSRSGKMGFIILTRHLKQKMFDERAS